MITMNA